MRRVIRIVFNSLALISLGLAVVVVVLWVRSGQKMDVFLYVLHPSKGAITLASVSNRSEINASFSFNRSGTPAWGESRHYSDEASSKPLSSIAPGVRWNVFGVGWWVLSTGETQGFGVFAPHWVVAVLSTLVGFGIWCGRGQDRSGTGLCPTCGYDLRASPERCPECGTVA